MRQPLYQLTIIAGVITCFGCGHSLTAPDQGSSGASFNQSTVYTLPPIRGLIRETNGGPIAGVQVGLIGGVSGVPPRSEKVATDDAGVFVISSSNDLCNLARVWSFEISKRDYWFPSPPPTVSCTAAVNPPEYRLEVKGQRSLIAGSGSPVEIAVSNDDLTWKYDDGGYWCGPCRIVGLRMPAQDPATLQVEWSGPEPIRVWIEGDRGYGDMVGLGEFTRPPDDTQITVPLKTEWRAFDWWILKVGLPVGERFSGSAPVAVAIRVRG